MFSRVSKFVSLSRDEQALLCTATVLLLSSRVLLPLARLDRTHGLIHWLVRALPPYTTVQSQDSITWALSVAATAVPVECSCLMQAVVGERLLADHGYQAQIRLGVASDQQFQAHAWVERHGEVVIGELEDHARYRPLWDYGS